jgi:uncharacterized protein
MSRDFPDWISPERAAEGKRVFSGTVPLSRMKRLQPLLAAVKGDASFVAAFRRDLDKRVVIDLQVDAALPLTCQASLEVYDEQVKRRCELVVIEHDNEQAGLPDSYDFVKSENGRLALAALVEDELLLGLPHVPRKPGLERVEYSTGGEVRESENSQDENSQHRGKKNPFAVLQDLLEREKQN